MINCPHCQKPIVNYVLTMVDPIDTGVQLKLGRWYRMLDGYICTPVNLFPNQNLFVVESLQNGNKCLSLHMENGLHGPFRSSVRYAIDIVEEIEKPNGFSFKVGG